MKQWYVIQVYAGYEEKVKADLERRMHEEGMQDAFGQVLIPSAKMKQFFDVGDTMEDQQLFPGYVLVELDPEEPGIFRLVTSSPRVLRFLGGKNPVPLPQREIDRVLKQMRGEVEVVFERQQFDVGSQVEIQDGAFAGFVGVVDSVDEESEKITVMVSIFGRMTPVELRFDQVKS